MTTRISDLMKAEAEIEKVLKKYEIAGAVCLASRTHAQFVIAFPKWSLINFKGESLQMHAKKNDSDTTLASFRLLHSLRDMLLMQFKGLDEAVKKFSAAIERSGGSIECDSLTEML